LFDATGLVSAEKEGFFVNSFFW